MPPANNTNIHIVWVSAKTLQQWKTEANPSRIDKVIAMGRVVPFFDSRCMHHFSMTWSDIQQCKWLDLFQKNRIFSLPEAFCGPKIC